MRLQAALIIGNKTAYDTPEKGPYLSRKIQECARTDASAFKDNTKK